MTQHLLRAIATAGCLVVSVPAFAADSPRDMYNRALAQERTVRDESSHATLAQMHRVVVAYETIVRKNPASGYCDNALWQAANVAMLAYERFGNDADRTTAGRLLTMLSTQYPASKLVKGAHAALVGLDAQAASGPASAAAPAPTTPSAGAPVRTTPATTTRRVTSAPALPGPAPTNTALLKDIHRSALPDGIRLVVDLDAEVSYHQEEIENPRRLFFDLKGVRTTPALQDVALKFEDDVVKEVRLGRHPQNTTRMVVDLEGISGYTVYPLYSPYRLVIDMRRGAAPSTSTAQAAPSPVVAPPPGPAVATGVPAGVLAYARPTIPDVKTVQPAVDLEAPAPEREPPLLPSKRAAPRSLPPAAPTANSNGKFSLSRQLGLSVSRIVIDAGHGGHDPGAHGNGVNEAELTLDVALRLQKLLLKEPGEEVVMTRDTDVFIPLEERTAIANRENADLFLSIHANASRNPQAHGIETYFLSFAMNPEAEAVAARENATSEQTMHNLPDIVKAIALNNKLNESRDLAATVQHSMVRKLGSRNHQLRDLGVKQAPFVVLIGAGMPSVLAEISFLTNKQDGSLLKTSAYRQQIAQALFDAVVNYQQGLKKANAITAKKATY